MWFCIIRKKKGHLIFVMLLEWCRLIINWGQDTIRWKYLQLKYTISKILISVSIFIALLWMSLFIYGSFYYLYMPSVSHQWNCNFLFDVCENGVGVCSFPTAHVDLTDDDENLVLTPGQAYKILLDLELPESAENRATGMFVISANFYNSSGDSVRTSSKTSMLRYRSSLLRSLTTLAYSPFLVTGAHEQKQLLHIEMFSKYMENSYNPAFRAVLQMRTQSLQLYSATLKIYAHFTGLRYLMFHWPATCAVLGTGIILSSLMFVAMLSWYNYFHSGHVVVQPSSHRLLLEERRRQIQARLLREGHSAEEVVSATTGTEILIDPPQLTENSSGGVDNESQGAVVTESLGSAGSARPIISTMSIHSVGSTNQEHPLVSPIYDESPEHLELMSTEDDSSSIMSSNITLLSSDDIDLELRHRHISAHQS